MGVGGRVMELKEYHEYEPKEPDYMYRIGLFAQMNHISVKTLQKLWKTAMNPSILID